MRIQNNIQLTADAAGGNGETPPSAGAGSTSAAPSTLMGGAPATAPHGTLAAAPDWRTQIPPEFAQEPSLTAIKTLPDLVKSYVSAQKLVGADKIAKPQANWTEQQWGDFYKGLGRPDAPDGYTFKGDKLPAGVTLAPEKVKATLGEFHKLGLTDKQANGVLEYYLKDTGDGIAATQAARTKFQTESISALKQEFGDKFDANIDIARSVVSKFGGDEFKGVLESSGLGDNPAVIRALVKIGSAMLDDTARGQGFGLITGGANEALAEIGKLKQDAQFMQTFMNRGPGHNEAVQKMEELHKRAFPEKK